MPDPIPRDHTGPACRRIPASDRTGSGCQVASPARNEAPVAGRHPTSPANLRVPAGRGRVAIRQDVAAACHDPESGQPSPRPPGRNPANESRDFGNLNYSTTPLLRDQACVRDRDWDRRGCNSSGTILPHPANSICRPGRHPVGRIEARATPNRGRGTASDSPAALQSSRASRSQRLVGPRKQSSTRSKASSSGQTVIPQWTRWCHRRGAMSSRYAAGTCNYCVHCGIPAQRCGSWSGRSKTDRSGPPASASARRTVRPESASAPLRIRHESCPAHEAWDRTSRAGKGRPIEK